MWRVYGLVDPRDEQVRYVGCTTAKYLSNRLNDHVQSAKGKSGREHGPLRARWIKGVLEDGLRPQIIHLQTAFSKDEAAEVEQQWINRFAGQLTNQLGGGPGAPNPSPELRALRSQRLRERWANATPEERAAVGERGKASIAKARKRAMEVVRGSTVSEERKEKQRQAMLGRRLTPEHIAKCSHPQTEETRKRISETLKAYHVRKRQEQEAGT